MELSKIWVRLQYELEMIRCLRRIEMSDDKEFGLTNEGTEGIKQIFVETKEPTLVSTPSEVGKDEVKKLTEEIEKQTGVTEELVAPEKRKRGRPRKVQVGLDLAAPGTDKVVVSRDFYCATCRERFTETSVMKMGAGTARYAAFCPACTKFLSYVDEVAEKTIEQLQKHPGK
jgi:hypothetical protein